jgi:hypothetical protein
MRTGTRIKLLVTTLVIALPAMSEAGPPLICQPFQTPSAALLPWGDGPGWNTPDPQYDVQRLTADTLRLLSSDAPLLARMENMRRASIYAAKDVRVAKELLAAVAGRAATADAGRLAIFDAGYLIETYKQGAHLFGRSITADDGYAMVLRAISMGGPRPEMEFAAALMTTGATSDAHLRRARSAAAAESLLAKNITSLRW